MTPAADQGVAQSLGRYQVIPRVLCFVFDGADVLLLKGAPDKKIWPGKYNGLGGHVERGEGLHEAARREIREEAGLEVAQLRLRGVVSVDAGPQPAGIAIFVFTALAQARAVRGSAEGAAEWIAPGRLASLDAVEDVPLLLARLGGPGAAGEPFSAHYAYDAHGELVVRFHDDPA